ncbi:hypothetical protein I3U46_08395 [Mycobacteroides abscessus subsp. massiliense]|uniref:hypothetical protein n=1 Tax=Mycobacteroides abscessus TaxID=36809 RepID=UPI0019CF5D93|nr:hypothetical protein [Mycobacteroides abscessus]MBN7524324.1 hypothetical protein [Mycobacteroides abscessus subsp. massiliense]
MAPLTDVSKPQDDPFDLIQENWPSESESAYHSSEMAADSAALAASEQAQNALDAETKMAGEKGQTAESVASGYSSAVSQLLEHARNFSTISGWMLDASGKVRMTKTGISNLVRMGTQEIRDALDSELRGTPVTPSSNALTDKYRGEIAQVAGALDRDLDSIGHALHGDPGSSRTPTYVRAASTPTTPTVEQAAVHQGITGERQAPEVTPTKLPEMPRATPAVTAESASTPSAPSAPVAPHPVNPTLANLVGGQGSTPSGTASPHTPSPTTGTPSTQAHQPTEQRQTPKPAGLPSIPSVPLPNIPAAAESIATAVSAATGHQLSTTTITPAPSVPASMGITPGVPGNSPMTPVTPMTPGLAPIGGGGLATPAVTQPTTPAPQAAAAAPPPAPQQTAPPRSPVVDAAWLQRTYGLAPGVEVSKSETVSLPALFIADLSDDEAHLHRVLASLRQQFEQSGWAQPLAVATIRKGFESKLVYVTSDDLSIHPSGILLPVGVIPLDEMPGTPATSDLSGSLMVTDKLTALLPRGWEVETLLSTVPTDENHQTVEQYQSLVGAGELLECTASRGRGDVTAEVAMSMFAHASLGSAGCGELDVESARLRAGRWVGVQPSGYGEVLSRWYLADAAESMSLGAWGEAVYCSERYLGLVDTKSQAA